MSNPRYDAFISYSHAADAKLAPALQRALQRFAKPWWKLRALNLFRDETSMGAASSLSGVLLGALDSSRHFILLASPRAAASKWCNEEVGHWLKHRSAETMLIVLTEGTIAWDDRAKDFDKSRTNAIPPGLLGALPEEPFWLDLSWVRGVESLDERDPRFRQIVARLAATLHGRSLEEISGEDVRRHKTTRRIATGAVVAIASLALGAGMAAWEATRARGEAERQRDQALVEQARAMSSVVTSMRRAGDLENAALVANRMLRLFHGRDTLTPPAESGLAAVLLLESWRLTGKLRGDFKAICISDDGRSAAVGARDGQLQLLSTATLGVTASRSLISAVDACAFSSDGRMVALSLADGSIELHDIASGGVRGVREAMSGRAVAIAVAADGRRVLAVSEAGRVAVVEATADGLTLRYGGTVRLPRGQTSTDAPRVYLARIGFAAGGRFAFVVPSSPRLDGLRPFLWDTVEGRDLSDADPVRGALDLAFSPATDEVALIDDRGLTIWNWRDGKSRARPLVEGESVESLRQRSMEWWLSFYPDGSRIAVNAGSYGGGILVKAIFDAASLAKVADLDDEEYVGPPHQPIGRPIISPSGRFIALRGGRGALVLADGRTGKRIEARYQGATSIDEVEFAPDESKLLAYGTRSLRIFDLGGNDLSRVLLSIQGRPAIPGADDWRDALRIARSGTFAFESEPGLIRFGTMEGRRADFQLRPDKDGGAFVAAIDPHGRRIVVRRRGRSDEQDIVEVHDLRRSARVALIDIKTDEQVAFASTGAELVIVDRHGVRWLDPANPMVTRRLSLERGGLTAPLSPFIHAGDGSQGVLTDGVFAYWITAGATPGLRKVRLESVRAGDESKHQLGCFDISRDGSLLAEFTGVSIRLVDLRSGRIREEMPLDEGTGGECALQLADDHDTVAIVGLGSFATGSSNRVDVYSLSLKQHLTVLETSQLSAIRLLLSGGARKRWTREAILAGVFLYVDAPEVGIARNDSVLCRSAGHDHPRFDCGPGPASAFLSRMLLAQVLATAERIDGGVAAAPGSGPRRTVPANELASLAHASRSLVHMKPSGSAPADDWTSRLAAAEKDASGPADRVALVRALSRFTAIGRDAAAAGRIDVATIAAERLATLAAILPSWDVDQALRSDEERDAPAAPGKAR